VNGPKGRQTDGKKRPAFWTGFGTILCAVDFSAPSRRALRHAAAVAARGHATLIVLFVNDPLLVSAAAVTRPPLDLRARSVKELDRFVRATLGKRSQTHVDCRVATGEPVERIVATAVRARADLIVIASRGLTGLARLAFGSTTAGLLTRSPIPVLVVPARGAAAAVGSWPQGRVIAPVALGDRLPADIDVASGVAEWFGCSLLAVHVLSAPAAPAWLRRRLAVSPASQLERARRRVADVAASRSRTSTDVRILEGELASAIGGLARRERAPLLLTRLRDQRHWFDPSRGSLTYRMLTQASVPLLACPPRWRPH
jgi:nucleotide-binding universal stress UspA family protein